jgi:putative cardiolipin synthase
MFKRDKFFIYFLFFVFPLLSFADSFPWIEVGQGEVQVIEDPFVEAEFRLELIHRAQKSLDIVTFDQRADANVGLPLIRALEKAASRGVEIRFAASWLATVVKDPTRKAARELKKIADQYPNFQFILVGGRPMWANGWGYLDGIHQKLFIVDREINLVTGRGQADEYLTWLDTAFVMKGKLVDQSQIAFDHMWEVIKKENGMQIQLPRAASSELQDMKTDASTSSPESPLESLRDWLLSPSVSEKTETGRVLHFNFLEQMGKLEKPLKQYSYDDRARLLDDPVLQETIQLVKKSKHCHLSILATIIDPRLKQTFIEEMKRGLQLEILTNGKDSHATITPIPISPGWYAGIANLDDLLQNGAVGYEVKYEGEGTFKFIHRKLLVCDDTVIFGSHNLTLASTLVQDEVSYELINAQFAQMMREISQRSIEKYTVKLNPIAIHQERLETPLIQWFSGFLDKLYLK